MHMIVRRIVALVVVLLVVIAATVPTSWAAEKVTVGIGGVALMVYLPTALAKSKGYFAEEGLDVEILDIKGGGSQAASALIGAVVGEYLGSHEGMGYVISYAESMFNATGVLAGLLVLMAAVIAIDVALKRLDARFSYWKPVPK